MRTQAFRRASIATFGSCSRNPQIPLHLADKHGFVLWQVRLCTVPHQTLLNVNQAIRAHALSKQWRVALRLLVDIVRAVVQPDAFTLSSAINACALSSSWETALSFLGEAELGLPGNQCRVKPNAWMHSSAIIACGRALRWEISLALLSDSIHQRYVDGLTVCFNAAISSLKDATQWEGAVSLLHEMNPRCARIDSLSLNAVVSACDQAGKWQLALFFFQVAFESRLANAVTLNAMLSAKARVHHWQLALSLVQAMLVLQPDNWSFTSIASACERASAWRHTLLALQETRHRRLTPTLIAYRCVVRACAMTGQWLHALRIWHHSQQQRVTDMKCTLWSAVVWACEASGVAAPPPPGWAVAPNLARKEKAVLSYVQRHVRKGDLNGVICAIEDFAQNQQWLKVAGGSKAFILESCLRHDDRVLELGTYIGYSSLVMARCLRNLGGKGSIVSVEVDAMFAHIARSMIAWAGAEADVKVFVGCAEYWAARFHHIDFVLLDHRGTRYWEALLAVESNLAQGARIFADNVLHPGAPIFLERIRDRYHVHLHEVMEFGVDIEDWVAVCHPLSSTSSDAVCRPISAEARHWSAEVDVACRRAQRGDQSIEAWQDHSRRFKLAMRDARWFDGQKSLKASPT